MTGLTEKLTAMLEPVIESLGYELLMLELTGQGHNSVLRLYIDSPDGIDLGDCERVSREVAGALDVCLLYTSPSPRDLSTSRMPSSA